MIVGAGATGGYFGGRLAQAGRDVTFLVRPGRAAQLRAGGLQLRSPHGDATIAPRLLVAGEAMSREEAAEGAFDAVILAVKAYALEGAMADVAGSVGPGTMIMPLLNGMAHMDALVARFGEGAVLGGVCRVATTLDGEGRIVQLLAFQDLSYGERDGSRSARVVALDAALQGAGFAAQLASGAGAGGVMQQMWEKWILLAAGGALTCLLRGNVGEIEAAGGAGVARRLLGEAAAVAAAAGHPAGAGFAAQAERTLTTAGSGFATSMYRDLVGGLRVEAEHIVGDMVRRAGAAGVDVPLLEAAWVALGVYEKRLSAR